MEENIYRKTLQVLRERGHCKGALEDRDGRVCIRGALNVADTGRAFVNCRESLLYAASDLALQMFPDRTPKVSAFSISAVLFNNHIETTQEDVETLLEKLAIREEEKV